MCSVDLCSTCSLIRRACTNVVWPGKAHSRGGVCRLEGMYLRLHHKGAGAAAGAEPGAAVGEAAPGEVTKRLDRQA